MHFTKFAAVAALATLSVSALPAAVPNANADLATGPVQALTARNLAALNGRSANGKGKSHKSYSHKSSKSGSYGGQHYRRIRSLSPTAKALKRSVWKYYKVRSAMP